MMTVRHIERLWDSRMYGRLAKEMLAGRPEGSRRMEAELAGPVAAAALAIVRLDEFSQVNHPLYGRLLRAVLAAQEMDGGWGDVKTTALCVRALCAGGGEGLAIQRGLTALAGLQKPEGAWPAEWFRRMPADALASAFVLYQLGDDDRFRSAVRFADALRWFELNAASLDEESGRLWERSRLRCGVRPLALSRGGQQLIWS